MTLRLQHYPRKNTEKQLIWSDGLQYMLNHGLVTDFESVLYCPVGRVLSRLETSSTTKFQFIHAPQYAYHMTKEPPNQPRATREEAPLTRSAVNDNRQGLVDGFNFRRTYTNTHTGRQNGPGRVYNNSGHIDESNEDSGAGEDDSDDYNYAGDTGINNADDAEDEAEGYDVDNDVGDIENDDDDVDVEILENYDDGGDIDIDMFIGNNDPDEGSFDDYADMRMDGLGDTSMSSRASTAIEGQYRDGVEFHKIPDHSMFLRTRTHRHIRPILIVEVKRLLFSETRKPVSINDLGYDVFSDVVREHARRVIVTASKQLKEQLECVFGEFGPDSISFVNAMVVAGPYYRRYIVTRPAAGESILLDSDTDIKELFDHSLSDITDDFYDDWKDICRSYDLHKM